MFHALEAWRWRFFALAQLACKKVIWQYFSLIVATIFRTFTWLPHDWAFGCLRRQLSDHTMSQIANKRNRIPYHQLNDKRSANWKPFPFLKKLVMHIAHDESDWASAISCVRDFVSNSNNFPSELPFDVSVYRFHVRASVESNYFSFK